MPWTFPFIGETKDLNEATRSSTPGSFVRLSDGWTHYELGGPSPLPEGVPPFGPQARRDETANRDGKGPRGKAPVVLVHGFSVPYFIWDPTFAFLAASGFCTLRYDLFGRGYSDRPKVRYDIDTFCRQLKEFLDILGFERVILVGLSLGGPISATFTARFPDRVQKLVLIDPAGARPVSPIKAAIAEITSVFSGLLPRPFRSGQGAKGLESDFYEPAHLKAFVEKYKVQMKYKGFTRALLATMQHGMLGDFSDTYKLVGRQGTPVMLLWGRDDKLVSFTQSNEIRAAIPQTEFHAFEHCRHIPHYEKPDEVNPFLLEFLK
jgi:pimeloyl-ACP methyl ester carboxylesterase